jgi:hypothetical protein
MYTAKLGQQLLPLKYSDEHSVLFLVFSMLHVSPMHRRCLNQPNSIMHCVKEHSDAAFIVADRNSNDSEGGIA